MKCRDQNKNKCLGVKTDSSCNMYYGNVPEWSVNHDNCPSVHDVIEDIYDQVDIIKTELDLSNLGKNCIDYSKFQKESKLKVSEALETIESEICKLKLLPSFFDMSKLDLKCLSDPCGNQITTLEQLLQILINDKCT